MLIRLLLSVVLFLAVIYSTSYVVKYDNKSLADCYRSMQAALDLKDQEKIYLFAKIKEHADRDLTADRKIFMQELIDLKEKREADVLMIKENILIIRSDVLANQKVIIANQEKILSKLSLR